jgi:EVE domain
MTFWMGVASAEHARGGRDGGFAQLGHGKHIAVKSLKKADWIVYYSPREGMGEGATVHAFTTIGRVTSEAPYRFEQAMDFNPYRVDVDCQSASNSFQETAPKSFQLVIPLSAVSGAV